MPCSTDAVVLTEDAVSLDCESGKSTEAIKELLSSKKITDGILALKAATVWPKEAETPAFNDEAATVYLNIVPKTMVNRYQLNDVGIMYLPHRLSMDRSVCYFGKDAETEEQQAEITQKLKEAGVLGKIKMVPVSLLKLAFETNNQEALAELPKLYDSFFRSKKSLNQTGLRELLAKEKKSVIRSKQPDFEGALNATDFWVNLENDGYIVKVGHTGLTDEQLQENIAATIDYIKAWEQFFPKGIANVKSVQLKTGTSEGISIHQDNSDEVPASAEDETKLALSAEAITDAISVLKAAADWPKEGTPPPFRDEAATAYLDILLKRTHLLDDTYFGVLCLPHALSLNRRVCYVGNDVEMEEQEAVKEKLKEAGVLGKIKAFPSRMFEKDDKLTAIKKLAQAHDTHIVAKDVRTSLNWKTLQPTFLKYRKYPVDGDLSDFGASLRKTWIWRNLSNDGFVVKVGHSGLTDEQLQENIVAVTDFFKRWDLFFPQGFASIPSIQLRSGTGKGISIHQNDSFKMKQSLRAVIKEKPVVVGKVPVVNKKPVIIGKKAGANKKNPVGKKPGAVRKEQAVDVDKPVPESAASGKNMKRLKQKRPAEAKQGEGARPLKQRREC